VLLRLMRGAGLAGVSGIRPQREHIIRPLLDVSRAEVEAFLSSAGESWREDESNVDRAIPRNRVRHDLMPVLRDVAGPSVTAAIARAASLAREDEDELERQAIEIAAGIVSMEGAGSVARIALDGLEAGPALARRILR